MKDSASFRPRTRSRKSIAKRLCASTRRVDANSIGWRLHVAQTVVERPQITFDCDRLMCDSGTETKCKLCSPVLAPGALESCNTLITEQQGPPTPTVSRRDRRYRLAYAPTGRFQSSTLQSLVVNGRHAL